MNVYLNWTEFKTKVGVKGILRFVEQELFYKLSYADTGGVFESSILKDGSQSADQIDFETNFKPLANSSLLAPSDVEHSPITRLKMAPNGWTYQLRSTEFESSSLDSIVNMTYDGTLIGDATIKFYNAAGTQLTTQLELDTDCVKTVLDWEPTYVYEIIGGTIKFIPDITTDTRLTVVAVPDVPAAYGGSKVMICNINLKFVDPTNGIQADGRVSKRMEPSTIYHTNKLRTIINHPAGQKIKYCLLIEHYKP